jgi:hypothetical protein
MGESVPSEDDAKEVIQRIDNLLEEVEQLRQTIEVAEAEERTGPVERRRGERRTGVDRRTARN